ncbi:NRPS protein [Claviceps pusilla]|uniref:NRPS protein n=1 Tax=Claviceps pusilla TaxID=123648 RepID=A0A9P7N7X2_9HYPO|nr:NRPS protein [Claviceps pusilla]
MSLSDIDESTLAAVAKSCNTSPGAIEDIFECTPSQTDMIEQAKPDVLQIILSFNAQVSRERWRQAFRLIISRNATLRTRFSEIEPGRFLQVVLRPKEVEDDIILPNSCHDIDEFLRMSGDRSSQQWLGVPLFQAVFNGSRFVASTHHGVMDYWSWVTLFNSDIVAAYHRQQVPDRPAFKDFVRYCQTIDESEAENFWQRRFRGEVSCFPVVSGSETASRRIRKDTLRESTFSPGTIRDVVRIQMPYYIEAAWAITSSIYTASDSVAYGYMISARVSSSNGLQRTFGPMISEVPVQVDLRRNMTVGQLVKDRAVSLKQLQAHPALHWGLRKIKAAVGGINDAWKYGTLLNILPEHLASPAPTPPSDVGADESPAPRVYVDRAIALLGCIPLSLMFSLRGDGFVLDPRFDPKSISKRRLNLVLDQFEHVLRLLLQAQPHETLSSLELLNDGDRARISAWNSRLGTEETAYSTVHAAFRAQVRVRPDATAVEVEEDGQVNSVDYRALDQMSDRLASLLRRRGISRNIPVCLVPEPSTWAIVAILGIMKAGGIVVPIDRKASPEMRAAIRSKVQAGLVLASSTQYATCVGLATDVLLVNPASINEPLATRLSENDGLECCSTDTALLYFTDGSTCSSGAEEQATGIMFAHRTLVSSSRSQAKAMGWQPGCRVLHCADYVSGLSMCEVFGTLLSGGCICIPAVKNHGRSNILLDVQGDWAILGSNSLGYKSSSSSSSSSVAMRNSCQQSILCMADPNQVKELTAWSTSASRLVRGWGISETCFISVIADETTPYSELEDEYIGFPIESCSAWIVDPYNIHNLAPVDSIGELLFSGASVAQGYWADDGKTATSFVSPPRWAASFSLGSAKLFRTGYLARHRMDGSIALVGKRSNRFKIRGHTVQLEQLERTLRRHCVQLRDVACLRQICAGRTQVVALVCLADSRLPSDQALQKVHDRHRGIVDEHMAAVRAIAESKLPPAVIPSIWHVVERLPRVNDGDLDRCKIRHWLTC